MTTEETQRLRDLGFAPCPKCGRWRPADASCLLCEPPAKPKRKRGAPRIPRTTRSQVWNVIRKLSLWSPEHAAALKASGHRCEVCGVKFSKALGKEVKGEVHHRTPIAETKMKALIIDLILTYVIPPYEQLQCLCKPCHELMHEKAPQELEVGRAENEEEMV